MICSSNAFAATTSTPDELRQLLDSYAERRGFNGTVLVARNGNVLVRASYGQSNVEWNVPNGEQTRYRIGSLTKPLVATLVMQLVEQDMLRLDGTLGEYLPELYGKTPVESVTISQLLSHTSGLADLPGRYTDDWWQTAARHSYTPLDFARQWIKPQLIEVPGQKWRYNNSGFFLLGLLIERATGKPLEDSLSERIFTPAGMTSSGLFNGSDVVDKLALGYTRSPEGTLMHPQWIDPTVFYSAAGIFTTADDLYRFDRALYGERLLHSETRREMLEVHAAEYGFGWGVENWTLPGGNVLPVFSHTGSVPGYQSYYLRSEVQQDCVIILDNFWQGPLVVEMGKDLMEVLNGKPMSLAQKSIGDLLKPLAYTQGLDAMVAAYQRLGAQAKDYDLSEYAFNTLGYQFLRAEKKPMAVRVFEWAVARYPDSANTHDSLGEAYRASGRLDDARRSYSKALKLDPSSKSARAAVAELGD